MTSEISKKQKAKNYVAKFFASSNTSINRNDGSENNNHCKVQITDASDSEVSPLTPETSSILSRKVYHSDLPIKDPSIQSIPSLFNKDFTLLRSTKPNNEVLLEGPRRILRLCIFVLIFPVILISVPLYARLVLYPPWDYPMAPTDQRLLNNQVSSFWCQGQSVKMNGSFNAYLVNSDPKFEKYRKNYTMLHHINLQDDVKEYWGFYFTAGSTITLSSCTRYDGGQLMILRGVHNLRKCAWIGENDSSEEVVNIVMENNIDFGNETSVISNDFDEDKINLDKVNESMETDEEEDIPHIDHIEKNLITATPKSFKTTLPKFDGSKERQLELDRIIKQAILLSKSKTELLSSVHRQGKGPYYSREDFGKPSRGQIINGPEPSLIDKAENSLFKTDNTNAHKHIPKYDRTSNMKDKNEKRSRRSTTDNNNAGEEIDDDEEIIKIPIKLPVSKTKNMTLENQIGGWMIPKGLRYDQGIFNQTNDDDASFEEFQSSFSSSEEALASCNGVILSLPLVSDTECVDFRYLKKNHMSYKIPISGTYYFVFSSDNEVFINDLYFNLTMHRVVYNTDEAFTTCINQTDCSLPLEFMSNEQAIVEVLQDGDWTESYTLHTTCEPRVTIYLTSLLLVPILILFCALR